LGGSSTGTLSPVVGLPEFSGELVTLEKANEEIPWARAFATNDSAHA
jgi:hypothetical protein